MMLSPHDAREIPIVFVLFPRGHVRKRVVTAENIFCQAILDRFLKMVKFFMQHLWMLHDVVVVWPSSCNNVAPGHAH